MTPKEKQIEIIKDLVVGIDGTRIAKKHGISSSTVYSIAAKNATKTMKAAHSPGGIIGYAQRVFHGRLPIKDISTIARKFVKVNEIPTIEKVEKMLDAIKAAADTKVANLERIVRDGEALVSNLREQVETISTDRKRIGISLEQTTMVLRGVCSGEISTTEAKSMMGWDI